MADIVVLGGTGFVGRNVIKVLEAAGLGAAVVSRATGVDLADEAQAEAMFSRLRPGIVINCAARVGSLNYVTENAADIIVDNSRMILSIYEGLRRSVPGAMVINPIANCAYPGNSETYVEERWWDGGLHRSVLSYGSSRRLLWTVGECFQMQHGIRSVSLLVPNMYGPNDSTDPNKAHALNALAAKFVRAELSGAREVTIWGTGAAIREWLYAEDFGRIVLHIIRNRDMVGLAEPLNIGQNFGLSIAELVRIIRNRTSFKGEIVYDTSRPDGAPRKVMDDRRFRKVFPDFQFTSFEAGLDKTVEFYRSIYPY